MIKTTAHAELRQAGLTVDEMNFPAASGRGSSFYQYSERIALIDILRKQIGGGHTREEKINHLREFLQILILKIIYDTGYFKNLSFAGGTALRILYDLRRFSEDLDFSLFKKAHFDFEVFAGRLKNQLELYGLEIELKTGESNIVKTIDIRFKNILMPLTLSSHKGEKLFVRIEIDSNPPRGAK